ncbi:MAG: type IX secretion system membrane protein PorP/SprF [Cyclobacteriaceae bacterium]|nr:type IX secretion system membrane protein PorP/SprF [Cyclobacteriaceae bacterium]
MSKSFTYRPFLSVLLVTLIPLLVKAQQRPYYTQYILNPYVTNPALAGIENYWDLKLSYRSQWSGVPGAPKTVYFTAHGPVHLLIDGSKVSPSSKTQGIQNAARNKVPPRKKLVPHSGFGFSLVTDKAGPVDITTFNSAYAYHLNLTPHTSLSAGASVGLQTIRINADALDFGPTNPNDPVATNGINGNSIKPDMSIGLWIYAPVYFVGVAAQNIIPAEAAYSRDGIASGQMVTHASLIAGYKYYINNRLNFIPSAMIRYVQNTPFNFDVNAKLQFEKIGWVGVSYRHNQSVAAMLGMNINQALSFGYTYDFSNSQLRNLSNGAHEVVIGFLISKQNRVALSPRNFW